VGDKTGKLLVLGWGSTHGAIREAVTRCRARGLSVSHAHVRNLNPFPRNLGELLNGFERVLVPELNMGQLVKLIRARYLIAADSYAKIEGLPFKIEELETRIRKMLES
jgi:2-oxoglutarate ferredoxin oxidoreductase subunit alpha